jgi:pimeloyl-ACP methyl ester carboxylesterase
MVTALILVGFALFGLGATTAHLTRQAEADFPATGRMITAGGLQQHVIERGDATDDRPVLVMIHGAYGAAGDFAISLMPLVEGRFHAVAVDRPGHGYSERGEAATPERQAQALHAAMIALGIKRPILLGFSFGGAVALSYALQYPNDTAAVVLINPASHPWRDGLTLPFGITDAPLLGPVVRNTLVTPVGHLLKDAGAERVFRPGSVPPAFSRAPLALSLRPVSYAANTEDIRQLDGFLRRQAPLYPDLRLPVEIVVDENDPSVSPDIHGRRLAREIADAGLIVTRGGGHPLHFSRPDAVLQAIDRAAQRAGLRPR